MQPKPEVAAGLQRLMQPLPLTRPASTRRGVRLSWPTWLGMLMVIWLGMVRPAYADTCTAFVLPNAQTTPSTTPMASGGTIQLDLSSCYFIGPGAFSVATAHGQASGTGIDNLITYTNNGDGAVLDNFTFPNPDNGTQTVTVTVNIASAGVAYAPASPASGTVGVAYSRSLGSASGGTAPYSYALASGALPAGLGLAANGTLSGTPTAGGTFNFTARATDSSVTPRTATSGTLTLTIAAPTIVVNPSTLPAPTVGTAYGPQAISASGGTAPYSFAITSGAMPAGMSLSAGGALSGTPTAGGNFNFTVTATDNSTGTGPYTGARAYSVTVAAPTLSLAPIGGSLNGSFGTAFSQTFTASGGTSGYSYALTINTGSMPAGLSFSTSTGVLSGTPTAAGTVSFTVTATDSSTGTGPYSTSRSYSLAIAAPTIAVSPTTLSAPTVGAAYSAQVTANGGTAPYSFAITSGALPAGMSLSAGGALSGTPTAGGNFNFTVTATDNSTGTGPYTGARAYAVAVAAPTLSLAPIGGSLNGSFGTAFSQTFTASGGTSGYSYALTINTGSMPAGLSFSASTGVLSGTPSAAGTVSFTVTATDSSTGTGPYSTSLAYTLTIAAPTITLAPASLPATTVGVSYSQTLTASGGTSPYTYAAVSGSLPAGLSLNANSGSISGTATAGGTFPITIRATDSNGFTSSNQSYSLVVGAPSLALSPGSGASFNGTAGTAFSQSFVASGGTSSYGYALTVTSGALPAGLAFSTATGVLSGTPTTNGTVGFQISATDSSTGSGAPYSVAGSYSLTVAAPTLLVSPGSLPAPVLGSAYSQAVSASGGVAPYTYALLSGVLPTGLSLNAASGAITGTPTEAGPFSFSIQATDTNNFAVSGTFSFTVAAPTVVISTATLANGQTTMGYTQAITAAGGIAPYTYAVTGGALPAGLSLNSSSGVLSGTPTANGSYNFTVTAADSSSGAGAPFQAQHSYTVVIAPQTPIAGSDSVATAFATPVTINLATVITGGVASSVAVASAPSHGSTTIIGTSVTYTPASGYVGSDSFTYTASNSGGTSAPGTVSINVQQEPPIGGAVTASVLANSAGSAIALPLTGGPATAVTVVSAPSHGSASVSGMALSYTPTADYFGQDSLTYTVSGPGGTSAPATVSITVAPLALPTAVTQNVSVLAGESVTIHAATGAGGGPFTAVAIVGAPSSGSTQISGTDIVFTAAANSPATVDFTYTLSNAFGTSAAASVVVTVNPIPVAISSHVNGIPGVALHVNLSSGASGGPFTAAELLAVAPAAAGQASISRDDAGAFILDFVPDVNSSGTVTIGFTLSNAYATSAPGLITVAITPRSDPSRDPEVLGLLNSQANATRRFATAQIGNFQQRLETLHQGGVRAFSNQLAYSSASDRHDNDELVPARILFADTSVPTGTNVAAGASEKPAMWSGWIGGAVRFGSTDADQTSSGQNFNTSGVSLGADRAFSPKLSAGAGVGFGHDSTDIGDNDSHSSGNAYSAAVYASYHPATAIYVDALLGYQRLSFDSRRYVTDNGNVVSGSRDGNQWFGSLAAGHDYQRGKLSISPYLRLDVGRATFGAYSERGDAIYGLDYLRQSVDTSTTSPGVHLDYRQPTRWGLVTPRMRLEYAHDFEGAGQAAMRYTDLVGGPLYSAKLSQYSQDRGLIGLGAGLQTPAAWSIRVDYQYEFSSDSLEQSIQLNLNRSF